MIPRLVNGGESETYFNGKVMRVPEGDISVFDSLYSSARHSGVTITGGDSCHRSCGLKCVLLGVG